MFFIGEDDYDNFVPDFPSDSFEQSINESTVCYPNYHVDGYSSVFSESSISRNDSWDSISSLFSDATHPSFIQVNQMVSYNLPLIGESHSTVSGLPNMIVNSNMNTGDPFYPLPTAHLGPVDKHSIVDSSFTYPTAIKIPPQELSKSDDSSGSQRANEMKTTQQTSAETAEEKQKTTKRPIDPTNTAHKCQKCNKVFSKRGNLASHMQVHNDERVKEFACHMCTKAYFHLKDLKRHAKRKHRTKSSQH